MEKPAGSSKKAIIIFLGITLLLSGLVWLLTLHARHAERIAGRIYGYGIMWCPALATYITCRILGRKISGLAWQWGNPRYLLWSYCIPVGYALAAYSLIWATGWGRFYNTTFVTQTAHELGWEQLPAGVFIVVFFIVEGTLGMAGSMSTALGEEIGWRGFLVPELSKITGYTSTSFISGVIWAVWHYPLLVFGNYNNGTPAWYALTCFTVLVISISFVFTWLRLKANSLWTGVVLHASHNLFIQGFFTPITVQGGHTKYFIDEFGAVLPVVTCILAVYFWSRRKELTLFQREKKSYHYETDAA